MDFITYHPAIHKFLSQFHQSKWNEMIISAILIGIPILSQQLFYQPDQASIPILKQQLKSMKEELDKLNKSLEDPKNSLKALKKHTVENKILRKHDGKLEETPRFQKYSPHKNSVSPIRTKRSIKNSSPVRYKSTSQWRTAKPPIKPRFIPKYLQNVDSKIKCDIKKDIATYKSLIESNTEESMYKNSLSIIDLSDKDTRKESQGGFFDSTESKSNSFSINSEVRLVGTLEGTFTKQDISHKGQPSNEIPLDRDFETPRYPTEYNKESEILDIAENFLSGPLMAELCNLENSSERIRCIKSQQVPPLDLLSSEENSTPFRQRWEEATKEIGKKWDHDLKNKDYRKSTTSREFYSGRSSAMMMVQTPSPIPYDDKLGPMCQDASYSKYF
jgi:hypothetical protein